MQIHYIYLLLATFLTVCAAGCHSGVRPPEEREESREAKQLMQGLWVEKSSGDVFFRMEGDTVYYPDSLVQPAAFRVVDDTLYIGSRSGYHIEKQAEHVLWIRNQNGEILKLEKTTADQLDDPSQDIAPRQSTLPPLTEVLKRDTVVMLGGQRFHCYIAINPTRYKVVRPVINDDGMQVDEVYYDNIVHISIFQGERQLFSRDFRKQHYQRHVPRGFLEQSILNNMEFAGADEQGFRFNAMLCQPDAVSCYMVENLISRDGHLSTRLLEY